ncbi:hypothetical protein ACPYPG_17575 [Streptomyces sp. FR-108]|uniref:hypothetical protein n=1 Tax=Streptomyces sp. FR-108 TaxID=3416665 RepID=UPI003CE9E19A
MSWSLSLAAPPETDLLDAFFLATGKALYLANAYERKCQYVLRVGNLVTAHQADPSLALEEIIAAAPADKLLGGTLHGLAAHTMGQAMDMSVLHKAREARNFIAHEGAAVGYVWSASKDQILRQASKLRVAVRDLSHGDNLISQWCHGLDEPHGPQPVDWIRTYPKTVETWVFGSLNELIPTEDAEPNADPRSPGSFGARKQPE